MAFAIVSYPSSSCNTEKQHHSFKPDRERFSSGRIKPLLPEHVCRHCGGKFRPKNHDRTTYCGRPCAYAAQKASALTDQVLKQRARDRSKARAKGPFKFACIVCDAPHISKQPNATFCSYECRKSKWTRPKIIGSCEGCGLAITGTAAKRLCFRCRRKKARSSSKPRKRARLYCVTYQPIDPTKVFSRDNWKCQICGTKTPAKQRGTTALNAPELDHRIPMSKGGHHTLDNVQCACRRCNMAKGNRSSSGQLPLFLEFPQGAQKSPRKRIFGTSAVPQNS